MGQSWLPAGRRAALSLTYDDALPCHRERVAPQLTALGLGATFYLCPGWASVTDHADAWRAVAALGHELGNHTLHHPCRDDPPGSKPWLDPEYDLCAYSLRRWRDEVQVANAVLRLIDGRARRSFGNTCHDLTVGRGAAAATIADHVLDLCTCARGAADRALIKPATARLGALGCWGGDGFDHRALLAIADAAVAAGAWAIVCMHGVGAGTHSLFVDADEHTRFIAGLAQRHDLWVASVNAVAERIATERRECASAR